MNKTLKFIVVSLGILIIILLIFTIFALISKYKKSDNLDYQNLILTPLVTENYQIVSFQVNNKELYLNIKDLNTNINELRVYNLKTGQQISTIKLNKNDQ